jgi:hypothetical protein
MARSKSKRVSPKATSADGFSGSDTMRAYVAIAGIALALVVMWAALAPFAA